MSTALANKLWSSTDDDRRLADVLVDGSNDRAARVARIGLWRSQDVSPGMSPVSPAPNRWPCPVPQGNRRLGGPFQNLQRFIVSTHTMAAKGR